MTKLPSTAALLFAAGSLVIGGLGQREGGTPNDADFDRLVVPFLREHCLRCHGAERQKGGLRVDELSPDFVAGESLEHWLEVIEKLGTGQMPPEDESARPSTDESAQLIAWLGARIEEGDAARRARRDSVSFHRLTREEYANTIEDLLGVSFDVTDAAGLAEDDRWRGFERIGSVLSLSASHVEKYLAAAEAILDEAYPDSPIEPATVTYSAVDLVGGAGTFGRERLAELSDAGLADRIRVDLWPGQEVRVRPAGGWIQRAGRYRIRVRASGIAPRSGRAPHLAIRAESIDRLLFEQDVLAPESEPIELEFEVHLPVGRHTFSLANDVPGPALLSRLSRAGDAPFFSLAEGRIPWQLQLTESDHTPVYPLLVLDSVEWEGPLTSSAESARQRYMPAPGAGSGEIRECLSAFVERAFRRPLADGEISQYAELVESELARGAELRSAVRTGMLAVLCSNEFLYLTEGAGSEAAGERGAAKLDAAKLDAFELASRLSYFLWSTSPDDELLGLAASGTLLEAAVLRSQASRMLADPRAERFAGSFTRQWLQLHRVGMFTPDTELYPDYDGHLERSMVRETIEYVAEVLAQDASLRELLVSDWTMLNPRLARHYGIANVTEDRFRRVALEPSDHRGGLLTHASVLSLTSDGTRHRPVHRGVWLSETILGETLPPPPANVEPLEPSAVDADKATVRMQLAAHASNAGCASCHKRTDPLGFAFENYDAIGRWRTEETVLTGVGDNPTVDPSGTLHDGRSFSGAAEFRDLLADDIDTFHAAFLEKLATYALRRPMTVDDHDELRRIALRSAEQDYRVAELIQILVESELFRGR